MSTEIALQLRNINIIPLVLGVLIAFSCSFWVRYKNQFAKGKFDLNVAGFRVGEEAEVGQ